MHILYFFILSPLRGYEINAIYTGCICPLLANTESRSFAHFAHQIRIPFPTRLDANPCALIECNGKTLCWSHLNVGPSRVVHVQVTFLFIKLRLAFPILKPEHVLS